VVKLTCEALSLDIKIRLGWSAVKVAKYNRGGYAPPAAARFSAVRG
jgi:hypothetical protein